MSLIHSYIFIIINIRLIWATILPETWASFLNHLFFFWPCCPLYLPTCFPHSHQWNLSHFQVSSYLFPLKKLWIAFLCPEVQTQHFCVQTTCHSFQDCCLSCLFAILTFASLDLLVWNHSLFFFLGFTVIFFFLNTLTLIHLPSPFLTYLLRLSLNMGSSPWGNQAYYPL